MIHVIPSSLRAMTICFSPNTGADPRAVDGLDSLTRTHNIFLASSGDDHSIPGADPQKEQKNG